MPGLARAVLCDLDDTLFDHRHATRAALTELTEREPAFAGWPIDDLAGRHAELLERLHLDVLAGRTSVEAARIERFRRLLAAAGSGQAEAEAPRTAAAYRGAYERAWRAVPGARELLAACAGRGVPVVIVTNNGVAEQRQKLDRCGLARYARALVTSEQVGASKPAPRIFEAALAAAGVAAGEAVMFGDAWPTDVAGARAAGIRAVWFNRLAHASPDARVPELRALEPTASALDRLLRP
jgi:putative hydrolase of the HAD superfamily